MAGGAELLFKEHGVGVAVAADEALAKLGAPVAAVTEPEPSW
jgi:hypothetical protein